MSFWRDNGDDGNGEGRGRGGAHVDVVGEQRGVESCLRGSGDAEGSGEVYV